MRILAFIMFTFTIGWSAMAQSNTVVDDNRNVKGENDSIVPLPEKLQKAFEAILEDSVTVSAEEYEASQGLDMGLMIVNETRTRNGAEFYDAFYQELTLSGDLGSANVFVKEEPFRTRMTRLIIHVNDVEVVQTILRPNSGEYMEELIKSSVQRVTYYVNNYKEVQESLNGDDLSGSGLF